jgi:hypothetical protein
VASTAALAVVGLLASAAGAGTPTRTVAPKRWARSVCPALADFVDQLGTTDEIVALSPSPAAAQMRLLAALDDAIASAGDVIATLRRAGTPDSRRGKVTTTTIAEEFRSIRSALVDAQTLIGSVSITDPDRFLADLRDAKDAVQARIGESYLVVVDVADNRIERALRHDRACRRFL